MTPPGQLSAIQPAILFDQLDEHLDSCREPGEVGYRVLDAAIALHGAQFGNLQLLTEDRRQLVIVAQRGFKAPFLEAFRTVSAYDSCACGQALRDEAATVIPDVQRDALFAPYRQIAFEAGFRAVQSTPLITSDRRVIGVLSTHFIRPHIPTEIDMIMARLYGRAAADTLAHLERKRAAHTPDPVLSPKPESRDESVFYALADEHVAQATARVVRQQALIERLRGTGLPTDRAESFLRELSRSLELMLWHRRLVKRQRP